MRKYFKILLMITVLAGCSAQTETVKNAGEDSLPKLSKFEAEKKAQEYFKQDND